ncbi:MAG: hypothetical protein ABI557_09465, partial [Aureliella sp.]
MNHIHKPLSFTALLLSALGGFSMQAWFGSDCIGRLLGQEPTTAETPNVAPPSEFLRMTSSPAATPLALETAIVSYQAKQDLGKPESNGVTVDLIGAVHIGEGSYYAELNRLFDRYDVLLYELVAAEGTVVPLGGKRESSGFNPVGMLQDSAKNMLGLESQLQRIDYTKPHFLRADMTPKQMADKMAERGDTAVSLALSTLADVFRPYGIKVYLTARFSAPVEIGGLKTADPHVTEVQNWWKAKCDE